VNTAAKRFANLQCYRQRYQQSQAHSSAFSPYFTDRTQFVHVTNTHMLLLTWNLRV